MHFTHTAAPGLLIAAKHQLVTVQTGDSPLHDLLAWIICTCIKKKKKQLLEFHDENKDERHLYLLRAPAWGFHCGCWIGARRGHFGVFGNGVFFRGTLLCRRGWDMSVWATALYGMGWRSVLSSFGGAGRRSHWMCLWAVGFGSDREILLFWWLLFGVFGRPFDASNSSRYEEIIFFLIPSHCTYPDNITEIQ